MGELSLPVDTTGQVGTQDRETATDHTTNKGSLVSSLVPHAALLIPLNGPIGSVVASHGLKRLAKYRL